MKFAPVLILVSAALHFVVAAHDGAALPKPADLPVQTLLPDPLVMLDGRKITSREMWFTERRPELIRLTEIVTLFHRSGPTTIGSYTW